jgi:hypothetical protein
MAKNWNVRSEGQNYNMFCGSDEVPKGCFATKECPQYLADLLNALDAELQAFEDVLKTVQALLALHITSACDTDVNSARWRFACDQLTPGWHAYGFRWHDDKFEVGQNCYLAFVSLSDNGKRLLIGYKFSLPQKYIETMKNLAVKAIKYHWNRLLEIEKYCTYTIIENYPIIAKELGIVPVEPVGKWELHFDEEINNYSLRFNRGNSLPSIEVGCFRREEAASADYVCKYFTATNQAFLGAGNHTQAFIDAAAEWNKLKQFIQPFTFTVFAPTWITLERVNGKFAVAYCEMIGDPNHHCISVKQWVGDYDSAEAANGLRDYNNEYQCVIVPTREIARLVVKYYSEQGQAVCTYYAEGDLPGIDVRVTGNVNNSESKNPGEENSKVDPVNNPSLYTQGAVECIEALEAIGIAPDFCRGNAIKYLWRAKDKGNELQDSQKAKWYLERYISYLEKPTANGLQL